MERQAVRTFFYWWILAVSVHAQLRLLLSQQKSQPPLSPSGFLLAAVKHAAACLRSSSTCRLHSRALLQVAWAKDMSCCYCVL